MVITGDYSGYVLFFFVGGKCAKIPLSSYACRRTAASCSRPYSDKGAAGKAALPARDTELAIRTSAGRMLLVNTAQIAAKTTRDSQGCCCCDPERTRPLHLSSRRKRWSLPTPTATVSAACPPPALIPRRGRGGAADNAVKTPPVSHSLDSPSRMGPLAWRESFA